MNDLFGNDHSGAEFSLCGKYRYKLWRIWDDALPKTMCIGLNPSSANANKNDPTINYLIMMLSILGFGGFYMTNLFAIISPKPSDILACHDPLGDNDAKLQEVYLLCGNVVVCWGAFKQARRRVQQVLPNYPDAKCFGVNKDGTPYHPLAMMYNGESKTAKLFPYSDLLKNVNV